MSRHFETAAVHSGRIIDPGTSAVAPPLHLSTTFERERDGSYPNGFAYTTFNNPNRAWLEAAMSELEGGSQSIVTGSGMAAIACVLSTLDAGERILIPPDIFQGTRRLIVDQLRRWDVAADVADVCDPAAVAAALTPATRMIWVDAPSNPLMRLCDIAALTAALRGKNILVVVDSTFATPALQQPLKLGADVCIHASTKYLGGHSDVVGGVAVFRQDGLVVDRARAFQINAGLVPSPFDCWLVHRGLRTLPLRMRRHSDNALAIARFLETHPNVERVYYPGLDSSQWHAVALRQMPCGCGGMVSFIVKNGMEAALSVHGRLSLFTRAASLGGVESLVEHRASSPTQTLGGEGGTGFVMPSDLLRLSVGIEHPADLIADLDQALQA